MTYTCRFTWKLLKNLGISVFRELMKNFLVKNNIVFVCIWRTFSYFYEYFWWMIVPSTLSYFYYNSRCLLAQCIQKQKTRILVCFIYSLQFLIVQLPSDWFSGQRLKWNVLVKLSWMEHLRNILSQIKFAGQMV